MMKIDKGVPIPLKGARGSKYPFAEMVVGESFFVPEKTPSQITPIGIHHAKRLGFKFTPRTVIENGIKGVRVWRKE